LAQISRRSRDLGRQHRASDPLHGPSFAGNALGSQSVPINPANIVPRGSADLQRGSYRRAVDTPQIRRRGTLSHASA